MEAEVASLVEKVDFSSFTLISQASIVVKLVMLILLLASVWSWTIIIQKTINFRVVRRKIRKFDKIFWSGKPLDELYEIVNEKTKVRKF